MSVPTPQRCNTLSRSLKAAQTALGADDAQEMAFTDFGIENLVELIKIHKDNPDILARR
jgi:hypothetical protein